ncbi:ATPase, T2SS/T4P/T4SS family [Parasporobacterium paucivorans]|uniref:Pilus assembly protein CpaF n=1 Tax=Parasporobacterium paucivorans DSM 15970 TaxID=1122934 RepID=A0A1M6FV68_9FIRM|nr:ATPase, T2SS/T4P/T4SS family [Parasporobacterium paucivorans]SHJ01568.1 pilus assembly protein CpaF [Parasporobacterium paucivorans DSM 15970]
MEIKLDNVVLDEINEYLMDENITDLNWNGRELWLDDLNRGRLLSDKKLSARFVENFSIRLANLMNLNFNKHNPLLEAETDDLRISIIHESVAKTGRSISIRKTPVVKRLNRRIMIESGFCPEEICNFMENAIRAHCSTIICGLPSVGKTEYLKALSAYIPAHERVATIEDNLEIHFKDINPRNDCVELKITESFPFEKAIASCLRHNVKWTLLSEARGREVVHLMNNLSNGTWCMTTLHANNVRKIPDRIANMVGEAYVHERFINNIYAFLDIGVHINASVRQDEEITRRIEQICVFSREDNNNILSIIYEDGQLYPDKLTYEIRHRFEKNGIKDPFREGGWHETDQSGKRV